HGTSRVKWLYCFRLRCPGCRPVSRFRSGTSCFRGVIEVLPPQRQEVVAVVATHGKIWGQIFSIRTQPLCILSAAKPQPKPHHKGHKGFTKGTEENFLREKQEAANDANLREFFACKFANKILRGLRRI